MVSMTDSVLKKHALLVKIKHNMQGISDIIAYHVPVFTFRMSVYVSLLIQCLACLSTGQNITQSQFSRDCDIVLPNLSAFAFA
jgi:hypothetical protein